MDYTVFSPWHPINDGLSFTAINRWLVDKVSFELRYLRGWEEVQPWSAKLKYGSLFGAGLEGWFTLKEVRAITRYVEQEFKQQVSEYDEWSEIRWWTELASIQSRLFVDYYTDILSSFSETSAERKVSHLLELPSGNYISLKGYFDMDGISENIGTVHFEGKCRGEWDEERIAEELYMDLQLNLYLLLYKLEFGSLPTKVWYQHTLKKSEDRFGEVYLSRIVEHMSENPDYYFYDYWYTPTEDHLERFCHRILYPILDHFLVWYYSFMDDSNSKIPLAPHLPIFKRPNYNCFHYPTPYGIYNPFLEGTLENFRRYRLNGTTFGLKRSQRTITSKEK